MDFIAVLKTCIYLIASSIFYPVLIGLVILTLLILIFAGSMFSEWIERTRLKKCRPENLPGIIRKGQGIDYLTHQVKDYIHVLGQIISDKTSTEVDIENLIQTYTLKIQRSSDRLQILIRVAPALGLIGTLIPMGTGLAALGQGDMTKLSSDLVIAFTTTVVGLSVGITSFFFYMVKKRWIAEDIKNMELATEILANQKK